jgi:hypothetical protein
MSATAPTPSHERPYVRSARRMLTCGSTALTFGMGRSARTGRNR